MEARFPQGLGQGVDQFFADVGIADPLGHDGHRVDRRGLAGVGVRRDGDLGVEGIGVGDFLDQVVIQAKDDHRGAGDQFHHRRGGDAGRDETHVGLVVLHALGDTGKTQPVQGPEIVEAHTGLLEDVFRIDGRSAAAVAGDDALAFEVGDGLDTGFLAGHDLDDFRVQGSNPPHVLDRVALELIRAVIGLVGGVVLDEGGFDAVGADQVEVGGGGIAGLGGDDHIGHLGGQGLGQHAAQGIVSAAGAAGGNGEELFGGHAAGRCHQTDGQNKHDNE